MVQPIQYQIPGALNPFENLVSGLKLGATMADMDAARAQQQAATQLAQQKALAEQAKIAQQKALQDATTAFQAKPTKTFDDYQQLSLLMTDPQASKNLIDSFEAKTKDAQNQEKLKASQYAHAIAVNPQIAIEMMNKEADDLEAAGDKVKARTWRDTAKMTGLDPAKVKDVLLTTYGPVFGKEWTEATIAATQAPSALREAKAKADKAVSDANVAVKTATDDIAKAEAERKLSQAKAEKEAADAAVAVATQESRIAEAGSKAQEAAVAANFAERLAQAGLNKTNWDVRNLQSQINDRSAKLNLDKQVTAATVAEKLSSIQSRLTEIPAESRKLINDSATLASTSKQAAVQFNDLAKRIEASEGGKGALTNASEWFAKATGRQDEWTQIRNEYTRVRNTVAIKSLPPGVATDKDIELALKGIPPENANSKTLGSFLRGMAKLQDIDSSINDAKTDWLSQNNGLLTRAKGTFVAGDYATKPGETFNDFAQRIVGDVSKKYRSPEQIADERRQQLVGQIPTNAQQPAAQQPAAPANIREAADAILRGGK